MSKKAEKIIAGLEAATDLIIAQKVKLTKESEEDNYYDLIEAIGKIQKVINEIEDREKDQ